MHRLYCIEKKDEPIRLRASINTGVCIAVNLNSNIDYFGNTVNVAAKLQELSDVGDIVLSQEAFEAPGVAELLKTLKIDAEELEFDSKAVGAVLKAYRFNIA